MITISYALRDDPLNIYMVSECVAESDKYTQTFIIRKSAVSPTFLGQYFYLDCKSPVDFGYTSFAKEIRGKKWANPYNYIATIDSQIEFKVSKRIFERLQESLYPLWTPAYSSKLLDNQDYGYLILLRVYHVPQKLDIKLLEKGRNGSALIMKLYDEWEEEACVQVDKPQPIISSSKFEAIKSELIHILKEEGALIDVFETDCDGIGRLSNHIKVMQLLHPIKVDREYDITGDVDRAQLDYEKVYSEAELFCPSCKPMINIIRETRPPQFGEQRAMIERAQAGDIEARDRLVAMNLRICLKNALFFAKKHNVDLEDCLQEAAIGILRAIEKYDPETTSLQFTNYFPWWIRQNIEREISPYDQLFRVPVHTRESLDIVSNSFLKHVGQCEACKTGYVCDDMLGEAMNLLNCDEKKAKSLLSVLIPPVEYSRLKFDTQKQQVNLYAEDDIIDHINKIELVAAVEKSFQSLSTKEVEVLKFRHGFYGRIFTLVEIAQKYNVTRERIRQIESKGLRKLSRPYCRKMLIDYCCYTLDELSSSGVQAKAND